MLLRCSLLLIFLHSSYFLCAQNPSIITPKIGLNFAQYKGTETLDGAWELGGYLKIGLGTSFEVLNSKQIGFDYNAFYFQEKYKLFYAIVQNPFNRRYKNHVLQNQFLIILKGERNVVSMRLGLAWDIVLYRESLEPESPGIYTGLDEKFHYQTLNFNGGISCIIKEKITLSFDYQLGLTPWYETGTPGFYSDTASAYKQSIRKSSFSLTLGYLIYRKNKRNSD